MTSVSKNMYIDSFISNNLYHNTSKKKAVNVNSSTYIDFGVENNKKDPKFAGGDHIRISKYKNIFVKVFTPIWSERVFVIRKVKNAVLWTFCVLFNTTFQEPNQNLVL